MYDFSDSTFEEISDMEIFSGIPASENDSDIFFDAEIFVEDDFTDTEQKIDTPPDESTFREQKFTEVQIEDDFTDTVQKIDTPPDESALSEDESTEDFSEMCYEELKSINAKLTDFDNAVLQIGENQYILISQTDVHLRYTNYLLAFIIGALVVYSFFSKL